MKLFSFFQKKSNSIPVNRSEEPEEDVISSDIVDLRAMRKKKGRTPPAHERKKELEPEPEKNFSFSERFEEDEEEKEEKDEKIIPTPPPEPKSKSKSRSHFADAATRFFEKKTLQPGTKSPEIISAYFPKRELLKSKNFWISVGGAVFLVGIVWILSTVFFKATIVIVPKQEDIPLSDILLTIDPAIQAMDAQTKKIQGELIQYSEEFSINYPATGEKYLETKARGIIIISNRYSSSPQPLVKSTRFQDVKTGKIFRLTKNVTVPGAKIENGEIVASTIEAEVQASDPGEDYNLAEGAFTIPGFDGTPKFKAFGATIKDSFVAGFKGNTKVVTKDDLTKAETEFQKNTIALLETKGQGKVPQGFILIPTARIIDILSETLPRVGDPGASFTIKKRLRLTNIAFQNDMLLQFLNTLHPSSKSFDRIPVPERSKFTFTDPKLDKNLKLNILVSGVFVTSAVVDIKTLASGLAGVSVENAQKILKNQEALETFGLKMFPFWMRTLPADASKINVQTLAKKW